MGDHPKSLRGQPNLYLILIPNKRQKTIAPSFFEKKRKGLMDSSNYLLPYDGLKIQSTAHPVNAVFNYFSSFPFYQIVADAVSANKLPPLDARSSLQESRPRYISGSSQTKYPLSPHK